MSNSIGPGWVKLGWACRMLGCHPRWITKLARVGRIRRAQAPMGRWFYSEKDVMRERAEKLTRLKVEIEKMGASDG